MYIYIYIHNNQAASGGAGGDAVAVRALRVEDPSVRRGEVPRLIVTSI